MSMTLISYVLTAALRDRLVLSLIVLMLLAVSLSAFMGSAVVVEQHQSSVVFAAGSLRLTGVFGLVLFVVFMIRRSFEGKDVEFLLSRPIGRVEFLLSYAAAFSILALGMGAAQGLSLLILARDLFGEGHWLWIASIMVENVIMVNVALFFSMMISSAASGAMVSFAFYMLARMMGQILGTIDAGPRLFDMRGLDWFMQCISALMPRLDLMGQSSWLIYGPDPHTGLAYILVQGVVFTALVLLASLVDLVLRQF